MHVAGAWPRFIGDNIIGGGRQPRARRQGGRKVRELYKLHEHVHQKALTGTSIELRGQPRGSHSVDVMRRHATLPHGTLG